MARDNALGQLAALGSVVPTLGNPVIGIAAGLGLAYMVTKKDPKWAPFWMAVLGSFVAVRASEMISQINGAMVPVAPPGGGVS